MLTFGFYNSINHDRRYSAIQFGSIFDGIIQDGIFMSIGSRFRTYSTGNDEMAVLVGPGRAWFNHTWTLNDAPFFVNISQSELLLDRIDVVALDINSDKNSRTNKITVIKGTPSKNPEPPSLIKSKYHNQYPLAHISVKAGVTSIKEADITNKVGTSDTPFVTGILDTINIDDLLTQWGAQWEEYFDFWKREWRSWYEAQTNEIQNTYSAWEREWTLWSQSYKTEMEDTSEKWKALWDAWFYTNINQNQQAITQWKNQWDSEITNWFDSLKVMLDSDVAANLANRIAELESCCGIVKNFMNNLTSEHAIYDIIEDDADNPIFDSDGDVIGSKIIFVVKQ